MPGDQPSTDASLPGLLLIVSGPSASGKSTLVERILHLREFPLRFSVSATSRAPRPGEVHGQDYLFISKEQFLTWREGGEFLEHAQVHDQYYGTPRGPVEEAIRRGEWVLLEIDVQGHEQVKKMMPEAISFFIRAGDMRAYEDRLRGRGTESDEQIAVRLKNVRNELDRAVEYDFQIVNEEIEQAVRTWQTLLTGIRAGRTS